MAAKCAYLGQVISVGVGATFERQGKADHRHQNHKDGFPELENQFDRFGAAQE